ncbi:HPP family protein [Merismopedia glauca]|uniref:HPP family protein n=1 Tax=Merismopedia glauca CCAP 1448/3 TaxID=1296344 RepID=A0A2T1CAN0_9CYAN|nr:HPP family protein [Merismopedia glauca]PSB05208.1 HPP family protein [Merismopedia glauca CCAP 1448/3]
MTRISRHQQRWRKGTHLSRSHQKIVKYVASGWVRVKRGSIHQPKFSGQQLLLSYTGSFLAIATLAYLSASTSYPIVAAPFGATAVLVFAMPESPLSQPRNIIGGNCLGAVCAIASVQFFGTEPWVIALAVATAIQVMQVTKTLHPPGGAVALVGVMSQADWHFLIAPALAGSIAIVVCTYYFNNFIAKRPYPKHWL